MITPKLFAILISSLKLQSPADRLRYCSWLADGLDWEDIYDATQEIKGAPWIIRSGDYKILGNCLDGQHPNGLIVTGAVPGNSQLGMFNDPIFSTGAEAAIGLSSNTLQLREFWFKVRVFVLASSNKENRKLLSGQ